MAQGLGGCYTGPCDALMLETHTTDSSTVRQDRLWSSKPGPATVDGPNSAATGNGAVSHRANMLRAEDAAVHDWYRFVLSFPPHLVAEYLDRFDVASDGVVLDPFCGTGTTLVEAKKRGVSSIGIEAMPMTAFASATKVDWTCDPQQLVDHAEHVASVALEELAADGISDALDNCEVDEERLRRLAPDQDRLVFKDAISPLPLHKTLVLLTALDRELCAEVDQHARLALASTIVDTASNLKFGPEVGVGKVKFDAPVVSAWLSRVRQMAADLHTVAGNYTPAEVCVADARDVARHVALDSIDAVITSPPYPNEKDYTRTVRLEAVLLGFLRDRSGLRAVKDGLLRSNTRNVFKGDDDGGLVRDRSEIVELAAQIEARRIELGKTSGFEKRYAHVTMEYFGGMLRHLRSLKPVLRRGARLAYVVGDQASYFRVPIPTGEILEGLAATEGYVVECRELFRTRFATATGEPLREEVLVLGAPPS